MNKTLLHVGFGHSGTTSLQDLYFSQRPDEVYYCGIPYSELGGIFSYIKYQAEDDFGAAWIERECETYIFGPAKGRIVVCSDETFVEQPEIYYTPRMMSVGTVARRLKALFGTAHVLFTLRRPSDYVTSLYLNLKRNYGRGEGMSLPGFDEWLEGNLTQVANLYLRNLDFSKAVRIYISVFGRGNVSVVPLESISRGPEAYLTAIGKPVGLLPTAEDVERYGVRRNRRMTVGEERMLALRTNPLTRRLFKEGRLPARLYGRLLRNDAPVQVAMNKASADAIREISRHGVLYIEREFDIDLASFGYDR